MFALGKINRILKLYGEEESTLTKFDKRLLKGFYVNDIGELENHSDKESKVIKTISSKFEINLFL